MKRICAIVCLLLCCGLLLTACDGSRVEENTLRIAYFPNITHCQALVMKEQGSLEQALGPEWQVEWTAFNAGPAEVEAFFAGEMDLGFIGPVPATSANVRSYGDFSVIAGACNGGAALVVQGDLEFRSMADLAGKVVAIPQLGNTQHLSLLHLLTENHMAPLSAGGDVEVVAAGNADILNMMGQGSIDAALVPEPWASMILEQTDAKLGLDSEEIWMDGDYATAVVLASKDFREAYPEIIETFLAVHQQTTTYIQENPEEAAALANRQIEAETGKAIDESILGTTFDRLRITEEIPAASLEAFAQLAFDEGFIPRLPDESLYIPE